MAKLSRLIESELEKAEITLAAKAISDKLQNIAETVAKIEANDLMPMMGSLKLEFGEQLANDFYSTASTQLRQLLANITTSKNQIDDSIVRMEGIVNGQPDAGNDMAVNGGVDDNSEVPGMDMGAPEGQEAPPAPAEGEDDTHGGMFAADDADTTPEPPEGRARKESIAYLDKVIIESFKKMVEKKVPVARAATYIAEKHGVLVSDVVQIIKEAKKKVTEKNNHWIEDIASKNKGKFSKKAKAAGKSTAEFAKEKDHAPGKLGQEARAAENMEKARKRIGEAKEEKKEPTAAQIKALQNYAEVNGKNWKSKLRAQWENGTCKSSSLVIVKNNFGPSWLSKFKLPTKIDEDMSPNSAPNSPFTTVDERKKAFAHDESFFIKKSLDGLWGCFGNVSGFCYVSNENESVAEKVAEKLTAIKRDPDSYTSIRKESRQPVIPTKKRGVEIS